MILFGFRGNVGKVYFIVINYELDAFAQLLEHFFLQILFLQHYEGVDDNGKNQVHHEKVAEDYHYQAISRSYQRTCDIHHIVDV